MAVHIFCLIRPLCLLLVGLTAWQAMASEALMSRQITLLIDEVPYQAELNVNRRLMDQRRVMAAEGELLQEQAVHYSGQIIGFPQSQIRLSHGADYWRGVATVGGRIYRIDHTTRALVHSLSEVYASPVKPPAEQQHICDDPAHGSEALLAMATAMQLPAELANEDASEIELDTALPFEAIASTTGSADCPDPVDGICLMPELEIAYDLSYQAIVSPGETVLDRATRELNELDLFFENSFNYRFSRVSMTFLDATQDAVFAAHDSAAGLLDALRLARTRAEMPFIQSPRSIFHFMTGRDFPPDAGNNVVGIAYLDVFCETFGLNTGLTDAGDAFFVSLVMAHEIGHNLGSDHDSISINGCAANTHVMTASIGPGAGSIIEFSSCSIADIQPRIASALVSGNRSQCLDFPVDLTLSPVAGNIEEPPKEEAFGAAYQIIKEGGSLGTTALAVEGTIDDSSEGQWISASITGGSCSVNSESYTCTVSNAGADLTLNVTASVASGAETFSHVQTVSVTGGDAIEFDTGNNSVVTSYSVFQVPEPDPASEDSSEGDISSEDVVTDGESGGSGSSGGGGAVSLPALLILLLVTMFRARKVGTLFSPIGF